MEATATTPEGVTNAPVVKPGYKTTEFWLTAGAAFVGLAIASGIVPDTGMWPKIVALVVGAFAAMGYMSGRVYVWTGLTWELSRNYVTIPEGFYIWDAGDAAPTNTVRGK